MLSKNRVGLVSMHFPLVKLIIRNILYKIQHKSLHSVWISECREIIANLYFDIFVNG